MMRGLRRAAGLVGACACVFAALTGEVAAQDSKSAALAKELAGLLDQSKLDSVAAKIADAPDAFVAALYFSGSELLVVSAKYSAPTLLNDKLDKKNYRDVYMDLNGAPLPDSKAFIEDLSADGLKLRPEQGQAFDTYETKKLSVSFDGDWKKQNMTEEDYTKAFTTADGEYAKMLGALVAALKKTS